MKNTKSGTGKQGEEIARKYLESKGYRIIAANYRFERAEADIIALDETKKILVFTEVKTRRNKNFGEPEESVSEAKQLQIIKAAEGFMMNVSAYDEYEKRFDVVAIYIEHGETTINHIENAF